MIEAFDYHILAVSHYNDQDDQALKIISYRAILGRVDFFLSKK